MLATLTNRQLNTVKLDIAMGGIRRVSHCSHWGAYSVLVDGDRIVGVEPFADDPSPSPIINSAAAWLNPDLRICQPMVREGWLDVKRAGRTPDGTGRGKEHFVPIDWDEALELVASEINRVRTGHGNDAIFAGSYGWTSCGRFHHASSLLKRMLNLVGGYTGHVDTYSIAAGPVILRHTLGSEDACGGKSNTLDTIAQHTQTLIVFGALSPRTAQVEAGGIGTHGLWQSLETIRDRGVRVVHISPSKDDMPEWVGAEWWPIRPNTDTALMLALAGEVVRSGRHDTDFLQRCTSGAQLFLDYLSGRKDGIVKDAAWAQQITGIDAGMIQELAGSLPETRTMVTVSWSLQRAHHGEQPFWAALGLASVLGQVGLPGGGVGYGYGSLGGVGAPFAVTRSPTISQLKKPNTAFIPVARITDLLMMPGASFEYQGQSYRYPDIRMVYWAGGNPFHHHQDLNRFTKAWTLPDTIVVQDPMWTATALRGDIVLPACSSLERNDLAGNRRSDVIVAMQKAVEPFGQSRSDYDIFAALAGRLGVEAEFTEGRDEMDWLRHLYQEARTDAHERAGFDMPDFDTFWATGSVKVPVRGDHTYLQAFRADPVSTPLRTESGRIVLGSETLAGLDYPDCPAHPEWLEPAEWLGKNSHSFHLVSPQPEGRLHSQLPDGPASLRHKRNGLEAVRIHPDDAAGLDINEGCTVRLWNDRGTCLASAMLSTSVARNVAILPTGSWFTSREADGLEISGNPNVLTLDIPTSSFGQGCSAHTCTVQIERFEELTDTGMSRYLQEVARLTRPVK